MYGVLGVLLEVLVNRPAEILLSDSQQALHIGDRGRRGGRRGADGFAVCPSPGAARRIGGRRRGVRSGRDGHPAVGYVDHGETLVHPARRPDVVDVQTLPRG